RLLFFGRRGRGRRQLLGEGGCSDHDREQKESHQAHCASSVAAATDSDRVTAIGGVTPLPPFGHPPPFLGRASTYFTAVSAGRSPGAFASWVRYLPDTHASQKVSLLSSPTAECSPCSDR